MTKKEFINAFKTIEGQVNPLQKFITKVGIIEMVDKSTDENVDIVFNELLESLTTTGVISKQENGEIRIEIEMGELPKTEESTEPTVPTEPTDEPNVDEPVIDEPTTEPTDEPIVDEPVIEEPTTEPAEEPIVDEPTTELPETEQ